MDALKGRRILVLVQGELAQSPRMLNHARELAAAGAQVDLVGFAGVALPPDLAGNPAVAVHAISRLGAARWPRMPRLLFVPAAALRALWLTARIGRLLLCALPRPHAILVQNPPAMPAATLAIPAARLRRAELIVDWHNLSAATLALRVGPEHALVRATERLERWVAGEAGASLCVSEALRQHVQRSARRGPCAVLYDRPLQRPSAITDEERTAILSRVSDALSVELALSGDRAPVVAVTATSWSQDEDMGMLLDAISMFAEAPLVLIATGLGPGRAAFEARARGLERSDLRIVTGWLAEDLYRDLLRAAHLGISMHRSASGLDLPMKIVDMIAAGLPILAYAYGPCLEELLPREHAAGIFTTSAELAEQLDGLLKDYPRLSRLAPLRAATAGLASPGWSEEWRRVALPIFAGGNS